MVKKFSKAAAGAANDNNLLGTVKESSSQIWLAGLGAFAKAQEEGSKVFEALVKEGSGLQKKFRSFADAQVNDMTNEVSGKITEATSKAAGAWDRLETVFEERVGRAVGRLGVPTKADIQKLTERVEELTKQVQKLNGGKAAPVAAKPAAAKKPAARKAAKKAA
uniref:Polyhydroxyalkanoate granule-associated protein PhaF n=1 Tax=uncultured bacterium A1Q1_fos_504 TaxID=1256580 RepID=L7VW29_9BACT|nr:polyhydroxyalkanoate granule-associated protein PhaF [uncultured bacterium A1Q1_fos_504]